MGLPKNLIILGLPGSGKGTQAKLLEKKFGLAFFGAGDLLREIAQTKTELGRKVHQTINLQGRLVKPELIVEVIKSKIKTLSPKQGLILEGFPRTLEQYEFMKKFWRESPRGDFQVIFIELSEAEAIKRLSKRLTCSACGAVYILGQAPEKCLKCEGELIQRMDDVSPAIKKRLELFGQETMPLIKKLEEEGRLVRINGSPSVEEVHKEILKKLNLDSKL